MFKPRSVKFVNDDDSWRTGVTAEAVRFDVIWPGIPEKLPLGRFCVRPFEFTRRAKKEPRSAGRGGFLVSENVGRNYR